jgi:predicted GH43/DUF377 family glycosyl hydrolase
VASNVSKKNLLITPHDVQAFHAGFEVVGTFNSGVTTYQVRYVY